MIKIYVSKKRKLFKNNTTKILIHQTKPINCNITKNKKYLKPHACVCVWVCMCVYVSVCMSQKFRLKC